MAHSTPGHVITIVKLDALNLEILNLEQMSLIMLNYLFHLLCVNVFFIKVPEMIFVTLFSFSCL